MIKIDSKYCSYITIYFYSLQFSLIFIIFSKDYSERVVSRSWKRLRFFKFNGSFFCWKKCIHFSSLSHTYVFSFLHFISVIWIGRKLFTHKCGKITNFCLKWREHENFPLFFISLQLHFLAFPLSSFL